MEKTNLSTEKTFKVNVKDLYYAWTNEKALKQWWKPGGRILNSVEAEVKESGIIKYIFEEVNDSSLIVEGVYKEVKPEEKLVYTWNWNLNNAAVKNGEYTLTVEFSEAEDESKIIVHQDENIDEEGIHPNKDGWKKALEDLEVYLNNAS